MKVKGSVVKDYKNGDVDYKVRVSVSEVQTQAEAEQYLHDLIVACGQDYLHEEVPRRKAK